MPRNISLPVIGREATVRAEAINAEARTVEVTWTTGAVVQRRRWEGWDDVVDYDEELVVDAGSIRLDRLNAGGPFLNSHRSCDLEDVLGSVVPGSVKVEAGRGSATIRLTSAPGAADVVHRILEGTVNRVSVGYRVHQYEITKKDGERELWRAVDWEPYEISAVAMPADSGASIGALRSGLERNDCVVTRADTSAANAARQQERIMPQDNPAAADQTRSAVTPTPPAVDREAILAEERQRSSVITDLCQRHGMPADFAPAQIASGASVDTVRAAVLDHLANADSANARRADTVPARASGTADVAYRAAIEEAILHRHNPTTQLSAGAREFRGFSLIEIGRDVLERGGISTRGLSKMELAGAVLGRAAVGYQATGDFSAILANVANKTLRDSYQSTPRTFAAWARRATISDFKPVQRTQLGGAPSLEKVGQSGEIKYGTMGESKAVYQLATYASIIPITRHVLINDDLDAFTRVPAAFGASAADLESDIVYAILTANPTMGDGKALFHADHGNVLAATAITETALAAVYKAFGQQKGLEGRNISIQPRFLIVPPGGRAVEARKQVTAVTPGSAAEVNPHAGAFEVISEPRLIPATGNDPWFVAADPARIDTIEYAYLEGQEGVFTETRYGFEVDGIEIKARHDFAAAAIDHRGIARSLGA